MGNERDAKTAVLTEANAQIRDVAERSIAHEEEWSFFCECGTGSCEELLSLHVEEYLALRQSGEAILAPGHHITRAEKARRNAQRLREEAQALQGQARLAVQRAREHLPDSQIKS